MFSILLLSENPDITDSLQSVLRNTYRLFEAIDTPGALKVLSSMPVDVVIIDSTLKNCTGIEGIQRITEVFPGIPLIFITLEPKSPQRKEAIALGAYGCIARPIDEEDVRFMVEKAVEKQGLLRDINLLEMRDQDEIQSQKPLSGNNQHAIPPVYSIEVIRKLSKAITAVQDIDTLILLLGNAISEVFGSTTTMVFIKNATTAKYEPASLMGVDTRLFRNVWFDSDHGLGRWLNENTQILRRESTEINRSRNNHELARDLKILRGEVVAPLSHQGELLGFMSLGNRINGLSYSDNDIELLALISVHTATALHNALNYQRITYSKVCNESILNNIRTGIIAIDTEARITRVNPFAQKLVHIEEQAVIGEDVQKAGSIMADLLLRTLRNHTLYVHHEVRHSLPKTTLSVSTSLLKDEEGQIIGAIAFFTDLSQVKELQSKIEDLEKVEFWSELSARMAHEIRNPLTSIKTFTQLFRERYDDPEFRDNFVEIVGGEIDKISSITDQLITYSEPFRGEVKQVEINGLIDECLADLDEILKTKKISIRRSKGPEIVRVKGRREMLKETFLRVLQNAIDFIENGSEITISIKALTLFDLTQRSSEAIVSDTIPSDIDGELLDSTHYVEIEFKDTGMGIPGEDISRIFNPFFSTKVKGIGLGLAIVEKTLQHHRGRIELDSKVGQGTSIRLIIPAYREI